MAIRVMVFGQLKHEVDREAFEAMITTVSSTIKGTPGYLKDELLCDPGDHSSYIMMSEWSSIGDFLAWEQSSIHKQNTSPLRTYWKAEAEFKIYDVVAS